MALFKSLWDDLRHSLLTGTMVTKLMLVNFIVFIAVSIAYFILFLTVNPDHFSTLWVGLEYLCMPADWRELIWRPWTPITSIFLHQEFWHFLSNIIWLMLFGNIVGDLIGDRRVLPLYLMGGIAGGIAFMISANLFNYVGSYALGASAAVMALGGAALLLAPDYRVMLILLGEIKLKYIVLVMLLLDMVGFANMANAGGHAAHIGGFLFGCFFVLRLREGKDMAEPVNLFFEATGDWIKNLFGPRPAKSKVKMSHRNKGQSKTGAVRDKEDLSYQVKLDVILDKIKNEGYESLNAEEKEFLFNASKR